MKINATQWRDLAARALWTLAQAGAAYLTTRLADIGPEWTPVLALALSAVKSFIGANVGDPDTVTFSDVPEADHP